MLTSLAATARARRRERRKQPDIACHPVRPPVERAEERKVRAHFSVEARGDEQRLADRNPSRRQDGAHAPDAEGGQGRPPEWIVRWPPTSGTSYHAAASLIPRNAARARSVLPTTVSTMPSGVAPIAAKSFTFVRTAAMPAP